MLTHPGSVAHERGAPTYRRIRVCRVGWAARKLFTGRCYGSVLQKQTIFRWALCSRPPRLPIIAPRAAVLMLGITVRGYDYPVTASEFQNARDPACTMACARRRKPRPHRGRKAETERLLDEVRNSVECAGQTPSRPRALISSADQDTASRNRSPPRRCRRRLAAW
jgi:hypothetical protein